MVLVYFMNCYKDTQIHLIRARRTFSLRISYTITNEEGKKTEASEWVLVVNNHIGNEKHFNQTQSAHCTPHVIFNRSFAFEKRSSMRRHLHLNSIFIGVICVFVSGGQQHEQTHFSNEMEFWLDWERDREWERGGQRGRKNQPNSNGQSG